MPAPDGAHGQEEQRGSLCTEPGLQVRVVENCLWTGSCMALQVRASSVTHAFGKALFLNTA